MLYTAKDVIGCAIDAADGEVGRVKDVYFDDETWTIRYLVVETGSWLNSQEVLLVPGCMTGGDPVAGLFNTDLTCKQVKESPPVSSDMPVSRRYEEALHDHYGWMPYWDVPLYSAPGLFVYPPVGGLGVAPYREHPLNEAESALRDAEVKKREAGDPHLRNFLEIKGYDLAATDGRVGHVTDALISVDSWRLTHIVVDPRNWLPGKQVVIDTGMVTSIDWSESRVAVSLRADEVREAPAFDPRRLDEERYLTALSQYFHTNAAAQTPPRSATWTGEAPFA